MKNVCIITVYNSENAGSFFQSFALKEAITNLGYHVSFLRRPTDGTSHDIKTVVASSVKCALKCRFLKSISYIKRYRLYQKAHKSFCIIPELSDNIDVLVYGSDTLWNFEDSYFRKKSRHYLGLNAPSVKKITYAVSASNTPEKTFFAVPDVKKALDAFYALGVRDAHTENLISSLTNKKITHVCDPTFLIDPARYEPFMTQDIRERYLLIYYFGDIDMSLRKWIIDFSGQNKLKIYNLGLTGDMDWCKSVVTSPQSFITYFKQADFVVTNTFHGAAFSIIFNRQFIAYTKDKQKVIELLCENELNDRICYDVEDADRISQQTIDFKSVNDKIKRAKEHSIQFLKEHLGE